MLRKWIILLFLGFVLGGLLGYVLNVIWYIFGLVVLGYGDSGPVWLTTIQHILYVFSIIFGVFVSQVYYFTCRRKYAKKTGVER
jgi:hypothetical protein